MDRIEVRKTVLNKEEFSKVVDTKFTSFIPQEIEEGITVEDFFALYDTLFFAIPTEGDFNSHQYLISKSSEVTNIEQDTSDIQPLLDEIASLREELLAAQQEILNLELNRDSEGLLNVNNLI
jgi:hypothetical protein